MTTIQLPDVNPSISPNNCSQGAAKKKKKTLLLTIEVSTERQPSNDTTALSARQLSDASVMAETVAAADTAEPKLLIAPPTTPDVSEVKLASPSHLHAHVAQPSSPLVSPLSAPSSSSSSSSPSEFSSMMHILFKSIFGSVYVHDDPSRQCRVVVKISDKKMLDCQVYNTAHTKVLPGVGRYLNDYAVLEDVRREARMLRLLHDHSEMYIHPASSGYQPSYTPTASAQNSSGSSELIETLRHLAPSEKESPSSPTTVTTIPMPSDVEEGRMHVIELFEEKETYLHHYLTTKYYDDNDLFTFVSGFPIDISIPEHVVRSLFKQICLSVRYLHARSVAHLDISLENVCLSKNKTHATLIDFGIAAQHPYHPTNKIHSPHEHHSSAQIRLVDQAPMQQCTCNSCTTSSVDMIREDIHIQEAKRFDIPLSKFKFLCRPFCTQVPKPGKPGYMSPETYQGACWDAYSNDCYALGVLLFCMLARVPPYVYPSSTRDVRFDNIYSGKWMHDHSRLPGTTWHHIPSSARHLINMLITPLHLRADIDTILKHEWLREDHTTHSQ